MSVITIRAHKRFGVCRGAQVRIAFPTHDDRDDTIHQGLLIELSLDGCRVSGLSSEDVPEDAIVTIAPEGADPFEARVRWSNCNSLGFRLERPFHIPELDRMIRTCRGEFDKDMHRAARA